MFNTDTCVIKEYWIQIPYDPNQEAQALEEAKRINEVIFKKSHPLHVYGFAKAVCRAVKGKTLAQWHVQVITAEFNPSQQFRQIQDTYSKAFAQPPKEMKPPAKIEFSNLLAAIKEVYLSIEERRKFIVKPEEIERKLNKLMINLLQVHSWPNKDSKTPLETVVKVFNHYKTCYLSIENQTNFNKFISQLNKRLHQQLLTIDEVGVKIITKVKRSSPEGLILFNRVKDLMRMGTERILLSQPSEESVVLFTWIFALHAYVYKTNADNEQAKLDLQVRVDRLIELLLAYDHQHHSSTLFNFTFKLMQQMVSHFNDKFSLDATKLASLVWTLEAFVRNQKFIEHMQPLVKQNEEFLDLASELFLQEGTWRAIADFIVFLGNKNLFCRALEKRIDRGTAFCTLDQNQIDVIFRNLNQKVREENPLFEDDYKGMYFAFLEALAKSNKLHFLKPYAKHPDHSALLRANLKKLDFSFMEGAPIPLESFFGNATYRAVHEKGIPHGMHVKQALVRLFTRYGENPVNQEVEFYQALHQVLADFHHGFDLLCEEILGKLGESAGPGIEEIKGRKSLIPTEKWLSGNVMALYQSLKVYVLMCLPLTWETETFDGVRNPLHRVYLHADRLYLAEYEASRQILLKDFFTGECLSQTPDTILVSELVEDVKNHLVRCMRSQPNRNAVSYLTESYMSLHHHDKVKIEIEKLLNRIFKKMRKENAVSFVDRLSILANFLHVMSPFFKKLDKLVADRFFIKGKLKKNIALNLLEQAQKIGQMERGESLKDLEAVGDISVSPTIVQDLSSLVSPLCVKDIEDILERSSLALLVGATSQFEYVICRKIDELSYTKRDFIQSFRNHPANREQASSEVLERAIEDLEIKEKIFADYGDFLKERPIPIRFILPNQALAIQLCLCPEFDARNLLIKLGTGQGKSLVIALAALHEAKKVKDKPKSRVLALTSYDHLAKRDQELGENFFKKDGIKSLCLSKIDDLVNFNSESKIIYADSENIDGIVREIMLKLLQNQATSAEKAFIKMIYGCDGEECTLILDEYDLILHDLEFKQPFVTEIPNQLLNVDFVRRNQAFWPDLSNQTHQRPAPTTSSKAADPSSGKEFHTVSFYDANQASFNLPVSIMRPSKLIKRAKRVIGLSGTALQNEQHSVNNALFFEIPSSQNPEAFGTQIQENKGDPIKDESTILCRQKIQFEIIRKEGDLLILSEATVKAYCDAIIEDIKAVREPIQTESETYQRPIVVFADPYLKYKTEGGVRVEKLWNTLKVAFQAAHLPFNELTEDVLDAEIQKMARSGQVTLTNIKYGRGADIRVSLDIEENLHVMVGTPVIHLRLLMQLIGRTGRMGRGGSYSAITIGDLIIPPSALQHASSEFYTALHDLTKFFVNKLTSSAYDPDVCKKWLMFLGQAYSTRHTTKTIQRAQARQLCGNFLEHSEVLEKFLK